MSLGDLCSRLSPDDVAELMGSLDDLLHRPAWRVRAACRGIGTDLFFQSTLTAARAVCADCPVKQECLADAMTDPRRDGVWAGTTERQRREVHRERDPFFDLRKSYW